VLLGGFFLSGWRRPSIFFLSSFGFVFFSSTFPPFKSPHRPFVKSVFVKDYSFEGKCASFGLPFFLLFVCALSSECRDQRIPLATDGCPSHDPLIISKEELGPAFSVGHLNKDPYAPFLPLPHLPSPSPLSVFLFRRCSASWLMHEKETLSLRTLGYTGVTFPLPLSLLPSRYTPSLRNHLVFDHALLTLCGPTIKHTFVFFWSVLKSNSPAIHFPS